ncbi:coiled-coil domain-containing protein 94 [Harpegnathos saltator]|uniref:Splicing factor YJU2 n=1 Tax=Harpegnathos saltator TaxID=610380 RepID=E2BUL0_HARSA|nr:coiled-coil domain-containing protein 94 [Harpegnathos saltator]EFN80619.1 Coiled-coil domain-containing protein 94 [Harpegnathos saltator]
MSERKVLNKYYPPDFDPSKIPRMKLARNRQYTVRLMAPFNMRCKTCGEYIYKGKKFNARKEDVEGDDYLGIRIYRFYIKCTRCLQEISFKTDPKNTDYEIEAGATRNFMALKLAEEQAQREEDEEKEEEATNPMKLLEKRTLQSKQELELLESLEELKDLNRRQQTIDYDQMLQQFDTESNRQRTEKEQEELDEQYIKSVYGKRQMTGTIVEEEIEEVEGKEKESRGEPPLKMLKIDEANGKEMEDSGHTAKLTKTSLWSGSAGSLTNKKNTPSLGKKSNIGIKINAKLVQNKTMSEVMVSNDKETVSGSQETQNTPMSISDANTGTKSDNTSNSLSLLGAYSDSSDNDSD